MEIIKEISELRKALERYPQVSDKELRGSLEKKAERKLQQIKSILSDEKSAGEFERYLKQIQEKVNSKGSLETSQHVLSSQKDEFIKTEMRLYRHTQLTHDHVKALLVLSDILLALPNFKKHLTGAPDSGKNFIVALETIVKSVITETRETRDLPRKVKKAKRNKNLFGRIALGLVGSTLALGNLFLSATAAPIVPAVAIASMTLGMSSLGAASFEKPEILISGIKKKTS